METYYLLWKIIGGLVIVLIAYALFVVKGEKKKKINDQ